MLLLMLCVVGDDDDDEKKHFGKSTQNFLELHVPTMV